MVFTVLRFLLTRQAQSLVLHSAALVTLSYLETAIELEKNPKYRYHLGMAYHKDGQAEKAKEELMLATEEANEKSAWLAETNFGSFLKT